MTATTVAMPLSAEPRPRLLERLDPLAKAVALLPAMAVLVFARTLMLPILMIGLAVVLLAIGARLKVRTWLLVVLLVPLLIGFFGLVFALWTDPSRNPGSPVYWSGGIWTLTPAGIETGFATSARLVSLFMLAFVIGTTTTARQLVLALITHLHLPYRAGYAILVGIRFIPQTRADLRTFDQARRVRGLAGTGPGGALRRWSSYLLPLAAGGLRRASRVALAMDARAFGAYPTRTERDQLRFTLGDPTFVLLIWLVTTACIIYSR